MSFCRVIHLSQLRSFIVAESFETRPAWRTQWFLMLWIMAALVATAYSLVAPVPLPEEVPLSGILAGITILFVGALIYRRFCWKFMIAEGLITRHYGVIARNQQSVRIRDLRSVELNQGLLQRLFNVGDLAFYSAGSAAAEVSFHGIKSPVDVRDRVHRLLDEARV